MQAKRLDDFRTRSVNLTDSFCNRCIHRRRHVFQNWANLCRVKECGGVLGRRSKVRDFSNGLYGVPKSLAHCYQCSLRLLSLHHRIRTLQQPRCGFRIFATFQGLCEPKRYVVVALMTKMRGRAYSLLARYNSHAPSNASEFDEFETFINYQYSFV